MVGVELRKAALAHLALHAVNNCALPNQLDAYYRLDSFQLTHAVVVVNEQQILPTVVHVHSHVHIVVHHLVVVASVHIHSHGHSPCHLLLGLIKLLLLTYALVDLLVEVESLSLDLLDLAIGLTPHRHIHPRQNADHYLDSFYLSHFLLLLYY